MKKTYNVSIGGRVFHLEEDAGEKLQQYIRTLENHYFQEEGGKEIMNDIECRIAELFTEYMQDPGKEVITLADIDKTIRVMGSPDDIIDEDPEEVKPPKTSRILYRNTDNNILGGVAAGIGTYFHISVPLVRLLFILLAIFYGITILVYIVLWIVVPPALTSRQKLEMKGEKINIPNIEKNIKDGINELKENKKVQDGIKKTSEFVSQAANTTGDVLFQIGKVLLKVVAGITFVLSLSVLVAAVVALTSFFWAPHTLPFYTLGFFMPSPYTVPFAIALFLAFLTPVFLLLWLSSKYLFRIRHKTYIFPLTLTVLWIVSIMVLVILGVMQTRNFSAKNTYETSETVRLSPEHPLVIRMNKLFPRTSLLNRYGFQDTGGQKTISGIPDIYIRRSPDENARITLIRKSQGSSQQKALENARFIRYNWLLHNDTLSLDNQFTIPEPRQWSFQKLILYVEIPENYRLIPDFSLQGNVYPDWQDYKGLNRIYTMTEEGLVAAD